MHKIRNKIFKLTLFFAFLAQVAQAAIVFEPYLGVPLGTADLDSASSTSTSGFGIGGRLYYEKMGFILGTDLKFSAQSSSSPEMSYEQNQLGLMGGLSVPGFPLRLWINFYFLDQMSVSQLDRDYMGGGYSLGLGFSPLPIVALNLEYKSSTYNKYDKGSTEVNIRDDEATFSALLVSLSFPFQSDLF